MSSALKLLVDMGTTKSTGRKISNDCMLDTIISEVVQSLVGEISECFVPQPSNESRTINVVNGISEFKARCRWAECWCNGNIE
jgi:hypothetical protein